MRTTSNKTNREKIDDLRYQQQDKTNNKTNQEKDCEEKTKYLSGARMMNIKSQYNTK